MISKTWRTSERRYGLFVERDVKIPMSDGIKIDCDIFRPDAGEKFPAILGVHPFDKPSQSAPTMPQGLLPFEWLHRGRRYQFLCSPRVCPSDCECTRNR